MVAETLLQRLFDDYFASFMVGLLQVQGLRRDL
jgi:hypothetical protein